jgi:hypothetical protein
MGEQLENIRAVLTLKANSGPSERYPHRQQLVLQLLREPASHCPKQLSFVGGIHGGQVAFRSGSESSCAQ